MAQAKRGILGHLDFGPHVLRVIPALLRDGVVMVGADEDQRGHGLNPLGRLDARANHPKSALAGEVKPAHATSDLRAPLGASRKDVARHRRIGQSRGGEKEKERKKAKGHWTELTELKNRHPRIA